MDLLTPDFGLIFWQTLILLVVLRVLGKFAWKPILGAMQDREDGIVSALAAAEEAKTLVAQVQTDKEVLLRDAHAERKRLFEEAIAVKQVIIEEAKAKAEALSQKIIEQAQLHLQKEREAAIEALRHQVVVLSIQIAEKLLEKELQKQGVHEQLAQRLIREARWS